MMYSKRHIVLYCTLLFVLTVFSQAPTFHGFEMDEFQFQGHDAKVVFPAETSESRPCIWRARFWGHEPQVDTALLHLGYHLIHVDVANLFGSDTAVALWDDFYAHCIATYKLDPEVVIEGMSRGGLISYNWAARHTDKVACMYLDAPVCDIKSWPGGLYSGTGSRSAWAKCLDVYGLDSISVLEFEGVPLHTSQAVAKAKIPVLHVYGDADKVVPVGENTALVAEVFEQAGHELTLMPKPGVGHHPHCFEDATPIINFIVESVASSK